MKLVNFKFLVGIIAFFVGLIPALGQVTSGVYVAQEEKDGKFIEHKLAVADNYLIHTSYEKSPANFISAVGGYYETEGEKLKLKLEFNSSFKNDSIKQLDIPFKMEKENLVFNTIKFAKESTDEQDLDGQWLFATRGPDTGQERRGDSNARKTLKFLMDGHFQWIAYHTESFRFSGTGGGSFSSKDGKYIENIEFFSRDNARVGAQLEFSFEIDDKDWHHKGKNSKGEPMYEIWSRRNSRLLGLKIGFSSCFS